MCIHIYLCMYIYIYMYIYICMYIFIWIITQVHIYLRTLLFYSCLYTRVHMYVYVCMYTYIYMWNIYIYTYLCIYTYLFSNINTCICINTAAIGHGGRRTVPSDWKQRACQALSWRCAHFFAPNGTYVFTWWRSTHMYKCLQMCIHVYTYMWFHTRVQRVSRFVLGDTRLFWAKWHWNLWNDEYLYTYIY